MDLTPYIGKLPYASEVFGVYRPMVGWASKRKRDWILHAERTALSAQLRDLISGYAPQVELEIVEGEGWISGISHVGIGIPLLGQRLGLADQDGGSFLMSAIEKRLAEKGFAQSAPASREEWEEVINEPILTDFLQNDPESETVTAKWFRWQYQLRQSLHPERLAGESDQAYVRRTIAATQRSTEVSRAVIETDSQLAAALVDLARSGAVDTLTDLFYTPVPSAQEVRERFTVLQRRLNDPFVEFDPTDELNGVTVSPIGIVHLYRQYFFEFDSFLGPSVEHVWLPPGATVELIESSTRRHLVERTTEIEQETTTRSERDERTQDELSGAVRAENRSDTKLGFSTTVSQSWPSGNATATGSINLDSTQQQSREDAYRRMREQSTKLSSEIRESFKTTFRTVTETTDVSRSATFSSFRPQAQLARGVSHSGRTPIWRSMLGVSCWTSGSVGDPMAYAGHTTSHCS